MQQSSLKKDAHVTFEDENEDKNEFKDGDENKNEDEDSSNEVEEEEEEEKEDSDTSSVDSFDKEPSIFSKIYNFTTGLASNFLNAGIEKTGEFLDVDVNDPNNGQELKLATEKAVNMAKTMGPIAMPILEDTAKNVGKLVGEAVDDAAKTAILGARDVVETIPGASFVMLANDATKLVQTGVHAASKITEEVSNTMTKLNDAVDKSTRFHSRDFVQKKTMKNTEVPEQEGGKTTRRYKKRNKKAAATTTRKENADIVKTRVQKSINKYIRHTKKKKN
jgi:hypothetical protein